MNSLCKDLYIKCIDFLEIHEFIIMLSISKISNKILKDLIPWRKPYITIHPFGTLTEECKILVDELIKNNPKSTYDDHYSGPIIHVALKLGINSILNYASFLNPSLFAIPWVFRNYIDFVDESEHFTTKIKFNKFLKDKLIKYKNKISTITDPILKSQHKIHYFDKLSLWETKIINYKNRIDYTSFGYQDNYFYSYNERLMKLSK